MVEARGVTAGLCQRTPVTTHSFTHVRAVDEIPVIVILVAALYVLQARRIEHVANLQPRRGIGWVSRSAALRRQLLGRAERPAIQRDPVDLHNNFIVPRALEYEVPNRRGDRK